MLKKIQRRFILAAMVAFGTVTLLIIAGINAANYYRTTAMQDGLAEALLSHEQAVPAKRQGRRLLSGRWRGETRRKRL